MPETGLVRRRFSMLAGLTGGIGCGKTTVLQIFGTMGWFTIDADSLVHEIYRNDGGDAEVKALICRRWGISNVTDSSGAVDRKKIAGIVFDDEKELKWLESVIHPAVFRQADKLIRECGKEYIMFDVPLLYEKNQASMFDLIVSVWSAKELQYQRLSERNWSIKNIESRTRRQLSASEKLEKADLGIINSGSLEILREQCVILDRKIREIQYGKKKISG